MKVFHFSRRQWAVLIGAAIFQCALIGVLVNSAGLFLTEIRQARGYSMSMISAHTTVRSISGALLGALLIRQFHKTARKQVFLFGAALSIASGFLLLTCELPVWAWYVIPVLLAPSASIGVVATPYLLAPWFPTGAGFASGFAMAFSGLGGVVFNPIAAELIERFGWQQAIWMLAAIMLALCASGLSLVFRQAPPAETSDAAQQDLQRAKRSQKLPIRTGTAFALCQLCLVAPSAALALVNYMSLYVTSVGYDLVFSAAVMSCIMVGNIVGKLLYGLAVDLLGTWRTTALDVLAVGTGICLFLFGTSSRVLLCLAGLLFGGAYAGATLSVSKCSIAAYGQQESKRWVGLHASVNSGISAVFSLGIGFLFDASGSFRLPFAIAACCAVISCAAATYNYRLSKAPCAAAMCGVQEEP